MHEVSYFNLTHEHTSVALVVVHFATNLNFITLRKFIQLLAELIFSIYREVCQFNQDEFQRNKNAAVEVGNESRSQDCAGSGE